MSSPTSVPSCNIMVGNKYGYDQNPSRFTLKILDNISKVYSGISSSTSFVVLCVVSLILVNSENKFDSGKIIVYVITIILLLLIIRAYYGYKALLSLQDETNTIVKNSIPCDSTNFKGSRFFTDDK